MDGKTIYPSFTGNVLLDTALRQVLQAVSSILSGIFVVYLTKHGFADQSFIAHVPTLMLALLSSVVTLAIAIWSVVAKKKSVDATVSHTMEAAQTGTVPDSVAAAATPSQKVFIKSINDSSKG